MRRFILIVTAILAAGAAAAKERRAPSPAWACMNDSQTRAAVAEHKLIEPLRAVRNAELATRADPLHSRLCQAHQLFVYELTLLRPDGKVIRLFMNAANGTYLKKRRRRGPPARRLERERRLRGRERPEAERERGMHRLVRPEQKPERPLRELPPPREGAGPQGKAPEGGGREGGGKR